MFFLIFSFYKLRFKFFFFNDFHNSQFPYLETTIPTHFGTVTLLIPSQQNNNNNYNSHNTIDYYKACNNNNYYNIGRNYIYKMMVTLTTTTALVTLRTTTALVIMTTITSLVTITTTLVIMTTTTSHLTKTTTALLMIKIKKITVATENRACAAAAATTTKINKIKLTSGSYRTFFKQGWKQLSVVMSAFKHDHFVPNLLIHQIFQQCSPTANKNSN